MGHSLRFKRQRLLMFNINIKSNCKCTKYLLMEIINKLSFFENIFYNNDNLKQLLT